jgi:7-cyano-7-deazaguanine synthase in queuosine biosynthesis
MTASIVTEYPKSGAKVIIPISGGRDSTTILRLMLKETANEVYAHHVSLRTTEGRWKMEYEAVHKIAPILQNERPFTYSESLVDYGNEVTEQHHTIIFMAAIQNYRINADYVMTGRKQHGPVLLDPNKFVLEHEKHQTLLEIINPYPTVPKLVYPLWNWSNQKIADYIRDLLPYTWSCRRPINNNPCGKCTTCLDNKSVK